MFLFSLKKKRKKQQKKFVWDTFIPQLIDFFHLLRQNKDKEFIKDEWNEPKELVLGATCFKCHFFFFIKLYFFSHITLFLSPTYFPKEQTTAGLLSEFRN